MTEAVSPEFEITSTGPVSAAFLLRGIKRFSQAAAFVKSIPYGRNGNKEDALAVFKDNAGTCSTKHALLKRLAEEQGYDDCKLMIGIFRMHGRNSPPVTNTLEVHGLSYIPEAHNYFRFNGHIFDYTFPRGEFSGLEDELMEEIAIASHQITDFKVAFHRKFLSEWLQQNPDIPYTLNELWAIREQCIQDLSKK